MESWYQTRRRELTMGKYFAELRSLYQREKFLVVSSISVMAVTFAILGFFLSLAVGFQTAIKGLEEQAQVTLFFKDDFVEDQILQLRDQLAGDERILEVNYISKEDAFKIFTDINKDEPILLEAISKDILPASLEIKAEKIASLSELAQEFESYEGVEEVKFFRDVIERFRYWTNVIYIVGGVLVLIFLMLSFSIILATIRINISAKADEIEILRLVGATDDYIRKPFSFQGISFGIVAAIVSSILMFIMLGSVQFAGLFSLDSQLVLIPGVKVGFWVYALILTLLLLLFGYLLGLFGSKAAVKRYLKL